MNTQPETRSGWLRKRGRMNKAWKRRYFVLSEGFLRYYSDANCASQRGAMEVRKAEVTLQGPVFEESRSIFKAHSENPGSRRATAMWGSSRTIPPVPPKMVGYFFTVQTENRVLELQADTEREALEWKETVEGMEYIRSALSFSERERMIEERAKRERSLTEVISSGSSPMLDDDSPTSQASSNQSRMSSPSMASIAFTESSSDFFRPRSSSSMTDLTISSSITSTPSWGSSSGEPIDQRLSSTESAQSKEGLDALLVKTGSGVLDDHFVESTLQPWEADLNTHAGCVNFLTGFPGAQPALSQGIRLCEHFVRVYNMGKLELGEELRLEAWKGTVRRLVKATVEDVLKAGGELATCDLCYERLQQVQMAVETFLFDKIHWKIFRELTVMYREKNLRLTKNLERLQQVDPEKLGITAEHGFALDGGAIHAFSKISSSSNPIEQSVCLQVTIRCMLAEIEKAIKRAQEEAAQRSRDTDDDGRRTSVDRKISEKMLPSTDDILSLILLLLIRTKVPHLFSHIAYIEHFLYVHDPSESSKGELGFHLTNFMVASEYLVSEGIQRIIEDSEAEQAAAALDAQAEQESPAGSSGAAQESAEDSALPDGAGSPSAPDTEVDPATAVDAGRETEASMDDSESPAELRTRHRSRKSVVEKDRPEELVCIARATSLLSASSTSASSTPRTPMDGEEISLRSRSSTMYSITMEAPAVRAAQLASSPRRGSIDEDGNLQCSPRSPADRSQSITLEGHAVYHTDLSPTHSPLAPAPVVVASLVWRGEDGRSEDDRLEELTAEEAAAESLWTRMLQELGVAAEPPAHSASTSSPEPAVRGSGLPRLGTPSRLSRVTPAAPDKPNVAGGAAPFAMDAGCEAKGSAESMPSRMATQMGSRPLNLGGRGGWGWEDLELAADAGGELEDPAGAPERPRLSLGSPGRRRSLSDGCRGPGKEPRSPRSPHRSRRESAEHRQDVELAQISPTSSGECLDPATWRRGSLEGVDYDSVRTTAYTPRHGSAPECLAQGRSKWVVLLVHTLGSSTG
ncbi:hypothetical protein CYMTET_20580 [Cymbomonas tetramitiformis]|uniref:VPS9 domain-containing protein n=1 Tax=Cymbomonas tetramitiformis TaxID=36881 RepID=A0AAE0L412_9CHLO|nr:hypothetical protein CYMTET_20580 [Cymbomonas tetramitiformis]